MIWAAVRRTLMTWRQPTAHHREKNDKTSSRLMESFKHRVSVRIYLKLVCSRYSTRSKECHANYVKCMSGQFSQPLIRNTFWTSIPCIIDLEPRDASTLVLCLLTGPSEFVVDFVKILTEIGLYGDENEIHGVLSLACLLVTCCVTNERWKITCFVTHEDNLTMLCTERDVEANVRSHLHVWFNSFLLVCGAVCTVSVFSLFNGCTTLSAKTRVCGI